MHFSSLVFSARRSTLNYPPVLLAALCLIAACGEHASVEPAPPPSTYLAASTINASQLSLVADGSSTATITVVLRDAAGNPAQSSAGTLSFETTRGTVVGAVDHKDGTYSATFTSPTLIGSAVISAKLNGVLLANTLTISLIAGPVDVARSVLVIDTNANTLPADGFTTCVISVEPRDTNNNPTDAGVGRVTFVTTLGTLAEISNAPDGRHSIALKSSAQGTAVVTAKIDDRPLSGSVTIRFIGNYWVSRTPLPDDRQVFGIGAYNGMLYVVGGGNWDPQSYSGEMIAYDPATNRWTSKTPMPTARGELAAGVINGILYAVGGWNNGDLNTVEAYDIAADKWTTKAPLPTAREGIAVAVVDGILYAIGGNARSGAPRIAGSLSTSSVVNTPPVSRFNLQSAEHSLGTVEAYDPATNKWTTKASMPTPRSMLAVGVVNGVIYALGGASGSLAGMRTVEAYDPATDTWTRKSDMASTSSSGSVYGRAALAAAVVNDTLYAIGGFAVYSETNLVEMYDATMDKWSRAALMPTMRQSLGAVAIDGIVYAVGGACYDDTLNAVEAYTPP